MLQRLKKENTYPPTNIHTPEKHNPPELGKKDIVGVVIKSKLKAISKQSLNLNRIEILKKNLLKQ